MAAKKGQLKILFIVALGMGIFGIILSALLASFAFMIFSLPNLSLSMFFGYKYYTHDKKMQQYEERKRRSSGRKRH